MLGPPTTLEEARAYSYCRWAGNPDGALYEPRRCAYEVPRVGGSVLFHQCARPNGHGPDRLYCRAHAKRLQSNT